MTSEPFGTDIMVQTLRNLHGGLCEVWQLTLHVNPGDEDLHHGVVRYYVTDTDRAVNTRLVQSNWDNLASGEVQWDDVPDEVKEELVKKFSVTSLPEIV